jgi:hypothetical protein
VSRAANYEAHRQRAAEFVNKAVTTALMDGPPADIEPPPISGGWGEGSYDGQVQFIRTAIEEFKANAPAISLDVPSSEFAAWPPAQIYAEAIRLSKWNKHSSGVTPMAMFVVRHAFWRFIAAALVYRKHLGVWPTLVWAILPSSGMAPPNVEIRNNGFLKGVHNWSDQFLRSAGITR